MKMDTKLLLAKLLDIHHTKNKHNANFKAVYLTKDGKGLIERIFGKLHTFHQRWDQHKTEILGQIKRINRLPKSTDYSYIPNQIRAEIEQVCNHSFTLSFPFGQQGRVFTVFLCLKETDEKQLESLVRRIYLWLSMASEHVKPSCSKTVNIYLYLIDKKKEVPSSVNEQIDRIHVNTAFTTSCKPHTNVHIFREEEWFRALIHESFHNLGFDFLQLDEKLQEQAEDRIRAIFPVKMRELRFNETYCEMWAEILNIIFFVFLSNPDQQTVDQMMKLFKKMLFFEGMFSTWQCVKILDLNHLVYDDLYEEKFASQYKEKTQGFSYYILKSIYMVHVSRFIHFCATQSGAIEFQLTSESIHNYTKIVEEEHDSVKYLNGIKVMEKEMVKSKKEGKDVWRNTLRMSLFEGTS